MPRYDFSNHDRLKIKFPHQGNSPKLSLHFDASGFKFKACEELVSTNSSEISPFHQRSRTNQFVLNTFPEDVNSVWVEEEWCPARGTSYSPLSSSVFLPNLWLISLHPLGGALTHRYFKTKTNPPPTSSSLRSFVLLMVQDWTNLSSLTHPRSVNWVQMIWRSINQPGTALMNIWSA